MQKPPDMRMFDAVVAKDHAVYDACMTQVCEHLSVWTRSYFACPVTFEPDHFVEDTRIRVTNVLRDQLGFPNLGKTNKSFLPFDLAFRMFTKLGLGYHVQRDSLDAMCDKLIEPMRSSVNLKALVLVEDYHPLASHHRARSVLVPTGARDGTNILTERKKIIDVPNDELQAMKKLINMPREKFLEVLHLIQPFLVDIDDTHVESPLAPIRRQLREKIEAAFALVKDVRLSLIETIRLDWESNLDLALLDKINQELLQETNDKDFLSNSKDVILQRIFVDPLEDLNLNGPQKKILLERKVLLEAMFLEIVTYQEFDYAEIFMKVHDLYLTKLEIGARELGYFALLSLITSTKIDDSDQMIACLR